MKTLSVFSMISILLLLGCNDNPSNGGDKPLALALKVIDTESSPLAGVNFHYIFYIGDDVVYRNAVIDFALPATDTVTLNIYDPFKNLIAVLLDEQAMPAGLHRVYFNGDTLTNGIYKYRLVRSSASDSGKFLIRTDDPVLLITLPALAQTDQNGKLSLTYSTLGIGQDFTIAPDGIDPAAVTISDSITVLLFKTGYRNHLEGIKLNTNTTTEKTITLSLGPVLWP